jgi:hypothetical protein
MLKIPDWRGIRFVRKWILMRIYGDTFNLITASPPDSPAASSFLHLVHGLPPAYSSGRRRKLNQQSTWHIPLRVVEKPNPEVKRRKLLRLLQCKPYFTPPHSNVKQIPTHKIGYNYFCLTVLAKGL